MWGLDFESGKMSREDFDIVTEVKMAKEKQVAKICVCPDEGCHQHPHQCKRLGCLRTYSTEHELCQHEVTCCNEMDFTCDVCKGNFKEKKMLQMHMYLHQESSKREKYSCPYDNCPRFYYVKQSLAYHIKSVHEGKKFECIYPDCGKKLSTRVTLNNHIMLHKRQEGVSDETAGSVMPEFVCNICRRSFKTKVSLERHMSDHQDFSEKETFVCSNYKEHTNSETNKQEHLCARNAFLGDMYKKDSITKINLQKHLSLHQKEEFFCDLCKRKLKTKEHLRRHMFLHQGKWFSCDTCKKVFTRKENMHRHMLLHKGEEFPCDICKKILKTKGYLKSHISLHGKEFPCDICKKIFRVKKNLIRHMSVHKAEVFPCDMCKRIFKTKEELQTHKSVHQRKMFACIICKETFTTVRSMHRHMSLHKQEEFLGVMCKKLMSEKHMHQRELLACDICEKGFTCKDRMQKHVCLYQKGVFPHTVCKKMFKQQAEVQRHVISQKESTENKLLHCHICKRRFKRESAMQKHLSLHHESFENERFTCDICRRVFKAKASMQKHFSVHKQMSGRMFFCSHSTCKKSSCYIKCTYEGGKFEGTRVDHSKELSSKVIAAQQASKRKGRWRQEDVEDLPISSTVASKDCKQRKEGMQPLGENPLTSLNTSPQKYENKKCLKENMKIQDKSLSLQSQKFEGQRDKIWKTVKIQTVPLNVQRTGDIARNMLQNPKAQGRKIHDNSSRGIENFIPVGKDFIEKDSKLKEMVESVMDGQQVERHNGMDPLNFQIDVRDWIYLMKEIMEEMFPTVKPSCL